MIRAWTTKLFLLTLSAVLCLNPVQLQGQDACCFSLPDSESTQVAGNDPDDVTVSTFEQQISSDDYTGVWVHEYPGAYADGCHWAGSMVAEDTGSEMTGEWQVGYGDAPAYNSWGWDYNGWNYLAVAYIQEFGVADFRVPNPCDTVNDQIMKICSSDWTTYGTNTLTHEVALQEVQNCRQEMGHAYAVCQAIGFHL